MAITYQFNITGIGKFNLIPSTTKLLGGKTTLTLTVQILPYKTFAIGSLWFDLFTSQTWIGIVDSGALANPKVLTKDTATSYTVTAVINPILDENPDTIENVWIDVNSSAGLWERVTETWIYNNTTVQYKYNYSPVTLIDESVFYQLRDSTNIYQGQEQSSFIYPLSKPFINLNRAGVSYDTFTTNRLQVTLEIKNSDNTDYNSFYLYWGENSFNCPIYITDPTSYKYRIHAIDEIGSEIYIPAEQNEEPQYYPITVLLYTSPQFTNDFSIVRHSVDTAAQEPEDKIDEEGEYAKLIGGVKITEFGGALARTATLTVNLVGTNGAFIDMSTGGQATLPFEVYTTIIDVNHLGQKVDGYYIFNNGHFYPTYTAWQAYSPGGNGPYSATTTYDFQLVLNDGFTTTTIDYQISSAEGILFIEPWGGIGINGKPFQQDG